MRHERDPGRHGAAAHSRDHARAFRLSAAARIVWLMCSSVIAAQVNAAFERAIAEMGRINVLINNAGGGRGLQFELFRPGQMVVKDYYAELPISVRVTGRYHDIGAFTADIANLSRIVTLNNLVISAVPPGNAKDVPAGSLFMEATARTYRYLDPAEVQAQKDDKSKKDGGKK